MRNNKRTKFIITPNNHIYKWVESKGYYLKLTPWEDGEDRRVLENNIGEHDRISYNSAMESLNTIWNNTTRSWRFEGENYKVLSNHNPSLGANNLNSLHHAPDHDFPVEWIDRNCEVKISHDVYKLCFYQGKIFWAKISQYYPRIILIKFEGINIPPKWSNHTRWANFKHCRPIFKEIFTQTQHEWQII